MEQITEAVDIAIDPIHLDIPIPSDLSPIYTKCSGASLEGWSGCFATINEATAACREVVLRSSKQVMRLMRMIGGVNLLPPLLQSQPRRRGQNHPAGCR